MKTVNNVSSFGHLPKPFPRTMTAELSPTPVFRSPQARPIQNVVNFSHNSINQHQNGGMRPLR